jgi:hypothetical protein
MLKIHNTLTAFNLFIIKKKKGDLLPPPLSKQTKTNYTWQGLTLRDVTQIGNRKGGTQIWQREKI